MSETRHITGFFLFMVRRQSVMKTFMIKFLEKSIASDILIEKGLLSRIPDILLSKNLSQQYILLTDKRVEELYGKSLKKMIIRKGLRCHLIAVPPGERSKTRGVKERVENVMFEGRHGRDTVLLALGGGVVGDLGGFVASTYLRGIPFIQIPTTLLSMVDSSIGGKTAINHSLGKNLIGSFHQPLAIFIDVTTLTTLPERDFRSGMAEVIKCGVILEESLFSYLEKNKESLKKRNFAVIEKVVERCIRLKGKIVKKDEKEEGLRKILNCGHTIGHSVEHLSSYRILHGEAVSIGIMVESYMSHLLGYLDPSPLERIKNLLQSFDLPIRIPKYLDAKQILNVAGRDKKSRSGQIKYVLPGQIGTPVDSEEIAIPAERKVALHALKKCY